MTRVKICGLTRVADVRRAVGLGVWACGFVLTTGPRHVDVPLARELAGAASTTLTVGVFTTEPAGAIVGAAQECGLDCVQLSAGRHGPTVEAVRTAAERRGLPLGVIAAADAADAAHADLVLMDSRSPEAYGGTGERADWAVAAARSRSSGRLVLAGGLRPSNVDLAIKLVRPLAVDVCGGVERSPGVKDHGLLLAFVGAAAGADAATPAAARAGPGLAGASAADDAVDPPAGNGRLTR